MGKTIPIVAALLVAVLCSYRPLPAQQDGTALFASLKCGLCHKPDAKSAGPSLKEIAAAYAAGREQLVKYLKGEAPAVVTPEKASAMTPSLAKIGDLSDSELEALAGYVLQPR